MTEANSERREERNLNRLKIAAMVVMVSISGTLYVHSTFAYNRRVDVLETRVTNQEKLQCLMAIKMKVDETALREMCYLYLGR